jgi:phosphatidate cytidylyltransferase
MTASGISEFFKRLGTGIVLVICFFGSYIHSPTLYSFLLSAILILILVFEWHKLVAHGGLRHQIITIIYPILPIVLLIWFAYAYYATDYYLPLYPVIIAWAADTGGYLIGKLMGYHKICPTISPGKSWEGLAGSFCGVIVAHLWLAPRMTFFTALGIAHNIPMLTLLSLAMTIIAFSGGFLLSYLKRSNNLKDAGILLPGHGGLLDRFDSVFFVTYATALIIFAHSCS